MVSNRKLNTISNLMIYYVAGTLKALKIYLKKPKIEKVVRPYVIYRQVRVENINQIFAH